MAKLIASLGALLLFGSFGAASAGSNLRQEPLSASELSGGEAQAGADIEEVTPELATSDTTASVPMEGMSEEEKERRRQACDRMWDGCLDRCLSSARNSTDRNICRERCMDTYSKCLKKIH
jgi:hypothetical protein